MSLSSLPVCSDDTNSQQCVQPYRDGGVYFNSYESCSASSILLPGFNLLPKWFLIGATLLACWCQGQRTTQRVSQNVRGGEVQTVRWAHCIADLLFAQNPAQPRTLRMASGMYALQLPISWRLCGASWALRSSRTCKWPASRSSPPPRRRSSLATSTGTTSRCASPVCTSVVLVCNLNVMRFPKSAKARSGLVLSIWPCQASALCLHLSCLSARETPHRWIQAIA